MYCMPFSEWFCLSTLFYCWSIGGNWRYFINTLLRYYMFFLFFSAVLLIVILYAYSLWFICFHSNYFHISIFLENLCYLWNQYLRYRYFFFIILLLGILQDLKKFSRSILYKKIPLNWKQISQGFSSTYHDHHSGCSLGNRI